MRPASDWSVVRIYLGALADGHRGGGALPVEHSAAGGREREPAEQAGAAGEVSGVPEGHRADARAPAERHAPAHRARPGMGNSMDVKGNSLYVKDNRADVKGNRVDVKGNRVDVKGNRVDVKDNRVDVKDNRVDVKGARRTEPLVDGTDLVRCTVEIQSATIGKRFCKTCPGLTCLKNGPIGGTRSTSDEHSNQFYRLAERDLRVTVYEPEHVAVYLQPQHSTRPPSGPSRAGKEHTKAKRAFQPRAGGTYQH
eukprot:1181694-Prorocentrum_minimum.AAC.6